MKYKLTNMSLHTQREEDIKQIKMIEQIIEKFEKKLEDRVEKGGFTYLYEGRDELDREEIENFIRSEFSSYNKQLLDKTQGDMDLLKTLHKVELDTIAMMSLEVFVLWSEQRKSRIESPTNKQ